jgi:subtilisin family serine protease
MKKSWMTGWLTAAVMLAGTAGANAAETSRVYVEFRPGQKNLAKGLVQRAGGLIHHEFDALDAVATTLPAAALAAIRNNPNVVLVEDDPPRYLFGCVESPEAFPYGLDAVQATTVWDANNDGAFDPGAPRGAGLKVGVIDSGLFSGHSDFSGVPLSGYPGGSYPAAWNTDRNGHGTHVTGTIAAQLNGAGVVGVSPGVAIHMVKVFGDDGGWIYSSTLLNAAQQCQTAGCKVISMSLGGGRYSRTEDRGFAQLYSAGLLLVAAAGNDGTTATSYPAGYASVVSVAAVDEASVVADFSQKNSDVELAAPGVGVLSSVPYCEENNASGTGFGFSGNYVEFAARGTASGVLVNGGLAGSADPSWAGKVVLVERGTYSFFDKVMNVQNSGGVACILYNNVSGDFLGTLGEGNSSAIPAISLSQENGQALSAQVGEETTVTSSVTFEQSAWAHYDGTSMATPHVSAVAALVWSAAPSKSNADIRQALTATALDLGASGRDTASGYGLVQAKAALDYLVPPGGDTTPPVISNVKSSVVNAKKGTFKITWTTNEPATSVVILNGNPFSNASLVTSHSMTFQGTKGMLYTYSVRSADAAGNEATAGPFTHQN